MPTRLLIAGLDGATSEVLDPLLQAGRLPTLAGLIASGTKQILRSTIPPISSAAWVTMLTGTNPGGHGIFDFRNLNLSKYTAHEETLANASSYSLPTLFDYTSAAGLQSVAFGVPMTYPPWPIEGVMIAGYPTPDHRRIYAEPPGAAEHLANLYTHSPDQIGAAHPREQAEIYRRYMRSLTDGLLALAKREPDLLMFVNGATDGAQHRFFKFVTPGFPGVTLAEQAQHADLLGDVMVAADAELGRLLAALPADYNILVISDHGGMARPTRAFNTNAWLAGQGWLAVRQARATSLGRRRLQLLVEWAKQSLPVTEWIKKNLPARVKEQVTSLRSGLGNIDWQHSSAYRVKLSHPIEGIHLNVSGRQTQGIVSSERYSALREEIMSRLRARPEVLWVRAREAVYAGPHLENAPDILFCLEHAYDGGADLDEVVTTIPERWLQQISGYHTLEGILVAAGPAFRKQAAELPSLPSLADITPTALHLLGLPVPAGMDGRVLQELLQEQSSVVTGPNLRPTKPDATGLTPEEEAGIAAALRDLGYIE